MKMTHFPSTTPPASLSPKMPSRCLPDASPAMIPQPGFHSQDSTARIPQPGFHSQDSTARFSQPQLHSLDSRARIPQSGFHSQDSTGMIPQLGFHSLDSMTRIPQPGFHSQDLYLGFHSQDPQPGFHSQDSTARMIKEPLFGVARWGHCVFETVVDFASLFSLPSFWIVFGLTFGTTDLVKSC